MIRDVDANRVLVRSCRLLTRWYEHATGLMFRKRLVDEGFVFVFPRIASWDLTNVFVFQTIDAVWLDEDQRVLQVRTITPFRFVVRGYPRARFVLELPANAATNLPLGNRVEWSCEQKHI